MPITDLSYFGKLLPIKWLKFEFLFCVCGFYGVLISTVHQSESVLCIHISPLFDFLPISVTRDYFQ